MFNRFLLIVGIVTGLVVALPAWATKTDDNFVDAGAPICLVSHTPPGGGSWTHKAGTTCASGTSGVAVNVSGTLHSYVNNNTAIWAADTATNDQSITVTLANGTAGNSRLVLRGTTTGSSQTGIVFGTSAGTATVCDMHSGTCNSGGSTASVSFTTGDTIQFIVSGTSVTTKKNGTTISGLNFTTVDFTTGTHLGILSRAIGDLYTSWLSDDFASNTLDLAEVTAKTNQIIPPANGTTTCSNKVFSGTYVGRVASNIDIQLYQTDGTTVVQAWTALTGSSISGGNWSGTLCIPFQLLQMRAQARETDSTGVTSAVTTQNFGAGHVLMSIGQSNAAHMWGFSARTDVGTTTNGSTTIGLPNPASGLGALPIGNWMTGKSVTGPNIPGGTTAGPTYTPGTDPETFIGSNAATATATGTARIDIELTPPTSDTMSLAYANGTTVHNVDLPQQTGEPVSQQAYGEGVITMANLLSEQFSGGAMIIESAVGGTAISHWITPSGDDYLGTLVTLGKINNDFSLAYWNQGETDGWGAMSYSDYLSNLRNVEAWVRGVRANVPFFITPLGRDPTTAASNSEWEAIKQAHLTSIDTDANVFYGGGEIEVEHVDDVHLSPLGRIVLARRMIQAILKQQGLSTSGYGPKIDQTRATWDGGTKVRVKVTQEGSATLTCKGLSTSCSAITGFRVFANGSLATISSTAFEQPNTIVLTLSARPTLPVTVDYQYGINPSISNAVYDSAAPFSDTDGLPLQPSRGLNSTGHFTAQPPGGFMQGPPG